MASIHRGSMYTGPRLFREQDPDDDAWFLIREPCMEEPPIRAHRSAFWPGDGQ